MLQGNYVQWKSRIKRYIDTKPNSELIHYCLQNPPYTYQWAEKQFQLLKVSSKTTTERSQQYSRNRGKAIVTSSAPTYDPEASNRKNIWQVSRGMSETQETSKRMQHIHKEKMLLLNKRKLGSVNQNKLIRKNDTDDESDYQGIGSTLYVLCTTSRGYSRSIGQSGPIFDDDQCISTKQ
ncbi:hypothetical protein Tco_1123184 [Tanacetum coccineum]|uniref:Uncharacterized protein n=1 Tax=Tanacetum coccineum TaxID=301880 RepID=A0ABQ5J2W6_9ASTR